MNVTTRFKIMRIEDFLAWEARQELKYELDGFEPVAMPGGSLNHGRIQTNLAIAVGGRLRGQPCAFYGSDVKVVSNDRVRYPDGQVICGKQTGTATFTTSPTILFEVVSPSDEARDQVVKLAEYVRVASLQTYVILAQDRIEATVVTRGADGWSTMSLASDAILDLPAIGIAVPLAELYEGIDLAPPADAV